MITENKIFHYAQGTPEIFCLADDFCKHFSSELKKHQLPDGKVHRNKPSRLSDAEVITILILFHSKGFRCLKHFYTQYVCKHLTHLFPNTVSYNRFVELQMKVALPMTGFSLYSGSLIENVKGKLCGDKGYIGKQLFEFLFINGIQPVTKVKNNMKNSLMTVSDKIMLRKRAVVESVNDELKNIAQIEHSRHRSFTKVVFHRVCLRRVHSSL